MRSSGKVVLAGAILLALVSAGCSSGSGGNNGSTSPPPPNVSVTISPTSPTLGYGATQQFKATVTGAANAAVTWSVSSSASSSSSQIGSVSSSGLYTAPAAAALAAASAPQLVTVTAGQTATPPVDIAVPPLNSVDSVTVTATSRADSSKSASATVTLTGLSILAVGQCAQATASQLNCSAGSTGTEISQGQTVFLFVAGFGIQPGTEYCISGSGADCTSGNGTDVVVTPPLDSQFQKASDGTPAVYFQVAVLPGATPGPRNLVVRNSGNEFTSFAGAVEIRP